MWIIAITKNENGSHDNQSWSNPRAIPAGYAVVNRGECENFPFGNFEVEEVNGVPTVTSWEPLPMPEPEPEPAPETEDDVWAELDRAYQEGVDSI